MFFGYERPLSLLRGGSPFAGPGSSVAPSRGRQARARSAALGCGGARDPGAYYFEVNSRLPARDLHGWPRLAVDPAEFRLYDFPGYRGRRDLANFSRHAEFYGQLQRGLKKVDMASMHHSLEVRVPLLDREVIDQPCGSIPRLHAGRQRKAPLRDLLARFVPAESIPKPKRGFAVPLGEWLRGPLRPFVEETLFGGELYPAGLFDRSAVREYWERHFAARGPQMGDLDPACPPMVGAARTPRLAV